MNATLSECESWRIGAEMESVGVEMENGSPNTNAVAGP